jgi:hypothetical protein
MLALNKVLPPEGLSSVIAYIINMAISGFETAVLARPDELHLLQQQGTRGRSAPARLKRPIDIGGHASAQVASASSAGSHPALLFAPAKTGWEGVADRARAAGGPCGLKERGGAPRRVPRSKEIRH